MRATRALKINLTVSVKVRNGDLKVRTKSERGVVGARSCLSEIMSDFCTCTT